MQTSTRLHRLCAQSSGLRFLRYSTSLLALLGLGLLAAGLARAETLWWTNTTGGNWNVAANWEPNRVPAAGDEVIITNSGTYTVTLNASASPARLILGGDSGIQTLAIPGSTLTLQTEGWVIGNGVLVLSGGTLTGTGTLTVSNVMSWTEGTMSGGGATVIAAGATLNISGSAQKNLDQRTLRNLGTAVWSGSGKIFVQNGAPLRNEAGGVFEVQNDVVYDQDNWTSPGSFHNAGLFRKTAGAGTTTIQTPVYNTGTIEVAAGTVAGTAVFNNDGVVQATVGDLTLSGGGSSSGQFELATNQVVRFTGGAHTLGTNSSWAGAGLCQIAGASVSVAAGLGMERLA